MKDKIKHYIEEVLNSVDYGKITIEVRGEKIDVVTEKRKRFILNEENKNKTKEEFRKG